MTRTEKTKSRLAEITKLLTKADLTVNEISIKLGVSYFIANDSVVKLVSDGTIAAVSKNRSALVYGLPRVQNPVSRSISLPVSERILRVLKEGPTPSTRICARLGVLAADLYKTINELNEPSKRIGIRSIRPPANCGRPAKVLFLLEHCDRIPLTAEPPRKKVVDHDAPNQTFSMWNGDLPDADPFDLMVSQLGNNATKFSPQRRPGRGRRAPFEKTVNS